MVLLQMPWLQEGSQDADDYSSMISTLLLTGCCRISQGAGSIPSESFVFALEQQLLPVSSTPLV